MLEILSSTTKTITWKIQNINKDLFKGDETKESKSSNHFTLINDDHYTEWFLIFQPIDGDFKFILDLVNYSSTDLKVDFSVNLVSSKNEGSIMRSFQKKGKDSTKVLAGWAWSNFVCDNEFMERFDDFLVDETLTFSCTLTVHLLPPSGAQPAEPSYKDFIASYKNLHADETSFDFKIESKDGKIFKVHKMALIVKSEVFKTMLNTKMKENREGICKIEDFDSKIVEAMVKHIYFQEIPNFDKTARELIYAAEKYELKELKDFCIDNIIQNLKEENVIEALDICDKIHQTDPLYKKCVAVVLKNWHKIKDSEECKNLSKEILLKLYKSHVDALTTDVELTSEK